MTSLDDISQDSMYQINKTLLAFLIFKSHYFSIFYIIIKKMENIFGKLQTCKDLKQELRYWCRQNGIKVSFTVNMTFTKSKTIYKKLENTYKKGYGKLKTRWLQNELKLFHFALLAISVLTHVKIEDFSQQQWSMLIQAFPNKLQPILEYEAKNFTVNKNALKKKWEDEEDKLLANIVQEKTQEPKWNQVATQLYIDSDRLYFRNGKQCRERWLNHLDTAIKHEKWTNDEDIILMKSVLECGKKWSRIMRCFNNQRTEHMIKNRFLSLILKCKKAHPFIQDEETAIKKISEEMGLQSEDQRPYQDQVLSQRKLRPKTHQVQKSYSAIDNSDKQISGGSYTPSIQISQEPENNFSNKNEVIIPEVINEKTVSGSTQFLKFNSLATVPTPSPSAFISPIQFMNCNSFFPNIGYFQYYMNDFYNHINSGSSFTNLQ